MAHSATKYLNGHSDVVAGALCGSAELIRQVFRGPYMTLGAMLAPNDAWLMIRGLRTLPIRLQRIAATTATLLVFLENHPRVRRVYSPHAAGNPQWNLSERQLRGASGLLTIELDADDIAAVERFCDGVDTFPDDGVVGAATSRWRSRSARYFRSTHRYVPPAVFRSAWCAFRSDSKKPTC